MTDTIFAPASGAGRAAIAILRLSGPQTGAALTALCGGPPPPRRASLRTLRDEAGAVLDRALVIAFPGPNSFTGEEAAELHLHGAPAILRAVSRRLAALPGLRPAEPGEFARRAFDNGRMDLTEADGLADLIEAETEAQRRRALAQSGGATRRACEDWAERLTSARAALEAAIDFSDEGDVGEASVIAEARAVGETLRVAIRAALDEGRRAERLRDGYTVALTGRPNAGKSSLLNALLGREAAIVSPNAGTTRDVIEAMLDIEGWPIRLLDLAGLRDGDDPVEQEGVRRARAAAEAADLRLVLVDGSAPAAPSTAADSAIDSAIGSGALLLWTKADAPGFSPPPSGALAVSVRTGAGLDALGGKIARRAAAGLAAGEGASFARERERAAARAALDALADLAAAPAPELAAEALRQASDALGRVTGRVDVEAVLDQVFGRFCIGK